MLPSHRLTKEQETDQALAKLEAVKEAERCRRELPTIPEGEIQQMPQWVRIAILFGVPSLIAALVDYLLR